MARDGNLTLDQMARIEAEDELKRKQEIEYNNLVKNSTPRLSFNARFYN